MISKLIIKQSQWNEMLAHVSQNAPLEACGVLAGKNERVEKVLLVRNQMQSPVRFVMDPYEQLQAFEWIESNGMDLIGIFHSHPTGPDTASATDIAEAAYEVVHVIWAYRNDQWNARGFWIENGQAINIPLVLSKE